MKNENSTSSNTRNAKEITAFILVHILVPALMLVGIVFWYRFMYKYKLTHTELSEAKQIATRPQIVSQYMEYNKDTYGTMEHAWQENGLYYTKTEKGTFEITFANNFIIAVKFTSNSGQVFQIR